MEDIKKNIAKNLVMLRKSKNLTQKELGKELNYSDKAISRWEIGNSLPDIDILIRLCEFYGVDFEWLLHEHDEVPKIEKTKSEGVKVAIALLFMIGCFTLATVLYVYCQILNHISLWQVFIWALQVSLTIAMLLSIRWWSKFVTTILLSIDLWVTISCFFFYFLKLTNAWLIYLIGVPIQIIIVLLHYIRKDKNKN